MDNYKYGYEEFKKSGEDNFYDFITYILSEQGRTLKGFIKLLGEKENTYHRTRQRGKMDINLVRKICIMLDIDMNILKHIKLTVMDEEAEELKNLEKIN